MAVSIAIDPITRIEGHLKAHVDVEGGVIRECGAVLPGVMPQAEYAAHGDVDPAFCLGIQLLAEQQQINDPLQR